MEEQLQALHAAADQSRVRTVAASLAIPQRTVSVYQISPHVDAYRITLDSSYQHYIGGYDRAIAVASEWCVCGKLRTFNLIRHHPNEPQAVSVTIHDVHYPPTE